MRIILVRHGETDWNIGDKRFRGTMDIPLSEYGLQQAEAVGLALQKENIDAIYYSALSRTKQTAQAIRKYHPKAEFSEEPLLLDLNFGDWQGRTHKEVFKENPENEINWNYHPEKLVFPNGESWNDVFDRIDRLFEMMKNEEEKDIVVFVSHRVVLSIILLYILNLDVNYFWTFNIDNASITELLIKPDKVIEIIKTNDTHHLK